MLERAEIIVSVVIAVKNGGEEFEEAIKSVLTQSFTNYEVVVVDDGSTDTTAAIIEKFVTDYSEKFRLITHSASKGLTLSLIEACNITRGKYIARIDADDLWLPEKLEAQMGYLSDNPDVVLLGTNYEEFWVERNTTSSSVLLIPEADRDIRNAMYRYNPFFHSAVVFSADAYREVGGYSHRFRVAQDYDLWERMSAVGKLANLNGSLSVRRMGEMNISVRREREQRFNALRVKLRLQAGCGVRWRALPSMLQDIGVIMLPMRIKRIVRGLVR